jgi:hypothetical protein
LQKELEMGVEEEEKRIAKFMTAERVRAGEKEETDDIEAIMEENPPLPEEDLPQVAEPPQPRKIKAYAGESFLIAENGTRDEEELVFEERQERRVAKK